MLMKEKLDGLKEIYQGKYNITYGSAEAAMYEGFMIEIANTAQHKYSSVLTFGFVTTDSGSGR